MSTLEQRAIGPVTVLFGRDRGRYPDANAILVAGPEEVVLIDLGVGTVEHDIDLMATVDRILLTHCHEDHIVGIGDFEQTACHVHEADLAGLQSMDGFLDIYGLPPGAREEAGRRFVERFRISPRPDAVGFRDGDVFDLGGDVEIRCVHTPGHTRGHTCFEIPSVGFWFVADIDLAGFGPYYGDAWSDLEDFERSLERAADFEGDFFLASHHIGLLEGRQAYRDRLDRYADRIRQREAALLDYLSQPRSMEEIVDHRFIYRPHDEGQMIPHVERRCMGMHLKRLVRDGVVGVQDDRYERL